MYLFSIARGLITVVFMTVLISVPGGASAQLPESVTALLQKANIPADAIAVWAFPLDGSGKPIIAHQASRSMQPASTMKLVTTIVALDQLGRIYRGKTELRSAGKVENGTLNGALIIKGGGDADLDLDAFANLLKTMRKKGVSHIAGDIIVDRTLFQPARLDIGVPPFDEAPEFQYNVIPDALLLNFNLLSLDIDSVGGTLKASISTPLENVVVRTEKMTTVAAACKDWEDTWKLPIVTKNTLTGTIEIALQGAFPANCVTSAQLNLLDKTDYIDRHFRAMWKSLGGTFSGIVKEKEINTEEPPTAILAVHNARVLPEVTRDINKRSDNALARQTYLMLGTTPVIGQAAQTTQSTLARADATVRGWYARHRIDSDGLVIENGSGLSRTEMISPQQLGSMLEVAWRSDYAPEFISSLPIVALDGTMRNRLKQSTAAGKARLKTGTLRNVVALAGYVNDANNTPYVVVAMINHNNTPQGGTRILDGLIDWIAQSKPMPTVPTIFAVDLGPQP
jgi:serine-type D-Ala-D-Ala carboxypeptidase/endopeptidase (penicillin-binding protein 4)